MALDKDVVGWPKREIPLFRPQYMAIVNALETDIEQGIILPESQLPTRRALAKILKVSLGTVTKAYEEAESRGLISGEIGRGTFVRGRNSYSAPKPIKEYGVNLSLNVSPNCGADRIIERALVKLSRRSGFIERLNYHPHEGMAEDISAAKELLGDFRLDLDAGKIFLTNGGQHAIYVVLGAASELVSNVVLTESVTFAGLKNAALFRGTDLFGVRQDEEGVCPDDLVTAISESGSRLLFLTPNLQTPTGAVMSEQRRREVVAVAREHDLYIIEDDAHGFLFSKPLTTLQSLAPERVFYISSFSKMVAPALRLGALIAPEKFQDRVRIGIASTGWMASPLLSGLFAEIYRDGSLHSLIENKRNEAQARLAIARKFFPNSAPGKKTSASLHIWLPFSDMEMAQTAYIGAAAKGVVTTLPEYCAVGTNTQAQSPAGLRVCLGGAADQESLETALHILCQTFENQGFQSVV